MKRYLLFQIVLLLCFVFVSNQKIVAQNWALAGNQDANAESRIGTTNGVPLKINTNNQVRMFIHPNGNIGIGTITPTQNLDVAGAGVFRRLTVSTNGETQLDQYYEQSLMSIIGARSYKAINMYSEGGAVYAIHTDGLFAFLANGGKQGVRAHGNDKGVIGLSKNIGVYGGFEYGESKIGVLGFGKTGLYGKGNTGVFAIGEQTAIIGMSTNSSAASFSSLYGAGLYASSSYNYAGIFDGTIRVYDIQTISDKYLKRNIQPIASALTILNQLQPKTYEYRSDRKFDSLHFPKGLHYGFLAQDLEQILPNLVKESDITPPGMTVPDTSFIIGKDSVKTLESKPIKKNVVKSVNYIELIPIMVKALQEQQEQINALVQEIKRLNLTEMADSSYSDVRLDEAYPNPAKDSVIIRYRLPHNVFYGQLIFSDSSKKFVKAAQLDASGFISVNVSDLANGLYNFSLIVNDKTILTRKMIIKR